MGLSSGGYVGREYKEIKIITVQSTKVEEIRVFAPPGETWELLSQSGVGSVYNESESGLRNSAGTAQYNYGWQTRESTNMFSYQRRIFIKDTVYFFYKVPSTAANTITLQVGVM